MSQMIESFMNSASEAALRARPIVLADADGSLAAGAAILKDAHPLHKVQVRIEVRVGEASMTVGDLLAARENELLVLDRALDDPVDLVLEGQVIARGQLVAVDDGHFAVRLTELPLPLKLA
jgi:flagellar motor switch protein FliN/FliY